MTADCNTAMQSTTSTVGESDAYKACDGVTETNYFNPPHCIHTDATTDNWWQVELTPAGNVAAVVVYFRSDCCSTFTVIILYESLENLYITLNTILCFELMAEVCEYKM